MHNLVFNDFLCVRHIISYYMPMCYVIGSLEAPDILSVMSEDTFQLKCLSQCIVHGANKSVR